MKFAFFLIGAAAIGTAGAVSNAHGALETKELMKRMKSRNQQFDNGSAVGEEIGVLQESLAGKPPPPPPPPPCRNCCSKHKDCYCGQGRSRDCGCGRCDERGR